MKYNLLLIFLLIGVKSIRSHDRFTEDLEDNEFAEFEDFDEDGEPQTWKERQEVDAGRSSKQRHAGDDDVVLENEIDDDDEDNIAEDEENEFDHFNDEEEFEGFQTGSSKTDEKEPPKITITKVPLHLRANWDSYYLEMLMVAGLLVYFLNFFTGRSRNYKLANMWFYTHKSLLEENFSLVGDDGKKEIENHGLIKESENLYTLWCSGRTCCEGMLVELILLKRQDLLAVMAQIVRPGTDQIHIRVDMNKEDMDSFVFCLAAKKTAIKLTKEMADLSVFCPEKKSGEKYGVPSNFSLMSEIGEVAPAMLDARVLFILNKYTDLIDYIHFSDQYSGVKQTEDTNVTKLPEVKKVLIFQFNIPIKGHGTQEAMEQMKVLLQLVFYCMDKVKRYRLSKEGKLKADKNRLKVEEAFLKTTHAARAEAAAARREEKKRQEKEKILQEDDPEKQRKWEEKEMKRQLKRKTPKMKQLKVKAL
ncbi:UNVERIFIED_CONTAM: hypothetical protein PYX00_002704 [Menopon gallinae]|uniref:PAT complex subunit CCDC47 n=1 Tax=Menopon gallinae TaxID=328185 RepID=A0AAW2HYV5_9NEOP